jgi:rod shape-determining protein MreC
VAQRRSSRRRDEDGVSFPLPIFLFCAILAGVVLYADRPDQRFTPLSEVRAGFNDAMLPLLQTVDEPLRGFGNVGPWWRRHFELAEENRALRLQIAELRAWRDVARSLQERNARYREALNLQGPTVGERITAWTVADQSTDFVRSRLIDAGAEDGVRSGFPVVNLYGIVGRTVDVGQRSSRVILLTDFNSRIAVMADRSNARALLVGDNSDFPRLEYLGRAPDLRAGDRIVTSGDDNVMPRGLPVGEAVQDRDGRWRVALYHRVAPIDLVWIWPFETVPAPEDAPALTRPESAASTPQTDSGAEPAAQAQTATEAADPVGEGEG